MKIVIVGGAGVMGQWFTRFFKASGAVVYILDPRDDCGKIADELGVTAVGQEKLGEVDIVLISVPIQIAHRVIVDTAPLLKQGALLVDITSIKRDPTRAMRSAIAECDIEALSIHPLFGPTMPSMKKQTMIFVPVRKGRLTGFMDQLFTDAGADVVYMDADEHDRIMAVVQGLTHFVYITFGQTLRELGFDIEGSRRYMSPVYEIMTDFVGRILHQDPMLYGMIQMNLDVSEIHETFLKEASKLSEIVKKRDIEKFTEEMRSSREHFGNTARSMVASDKLVNFKVKEDD
ncbi:MAG: prephenate dehydrogenase/arogenate dehydrogenase family protein [Candidatus Syntropharchaeales archaeon]